MPQVVACAVVQGATPRVFVADDMETLNWVLALQVVGQTTRSAVPEDVGDQLRSALLEERWGDAVLRWIEHFDSPIDVYSSHDFFVTSDVAMAPDELQFSPLFGGPTDG